MSNFDVSSNNVFKGDMTRATLFDFLNTFNMVDVWRVLHLGEKGYSQRQVVQGKVKQTRLDMIFADPELVKKINYVRYVQNVWSDHSTVEFTINDHVYCKHFSMWAFNASLLKDVSFRKSMSSLLKKAL